jgi:hypothetical protein
MKRVIVLLLLLIMCRSVDAAESYWDKYCPENCRKVEVKFTFYIMQMKVYEEARELYWGPGRSDIKAFVVHYKDGTSTIFMPLNNILKFREKSDKLLESVSSADAKSEIRYKMYLERVGQYYFSDQYVDVCDVGHETLHVVDNTLELEGRVKMFNLP